MLSVGVRLPTSGSNGYGRHAAATERGLEGSPGRWRILLLRGYTGTVNASYSYSAAGAVGGDCLCLNGILIFGV